LHLSVTRHLVSGHRLVQDGTENIQHALVATRIPWLRPGFCAHRETTDGPYGPALRVLKHAGLHFRTGCSSRSRPLRPLVAPSAEHRCYRASSVRL